MKSALFLVLVGLMCGSGSLAAEFSPQRAADTHEELRGAVQKVVPSGWAVIVSPAEPALVISCEKNLSVEYRSVASFQVLKRANERVAVRFVAAPFVSPERHASIQQRNRERRQRRIQFEDRHLSKMAEATTLTFKLELPIPPTRYKPQTGQEKHTITEYAFLWLRTQPKNLPSHAFKDISFHRHGLKRGASIVDEAKAREYNSIMKSVEKMIEPYKSPR